MPGGRCQPRMSFPNEGGLPDDPKHPQASRLVFKLPPRRQPHRSSARRTRSGAHGQLAVPASLAMLTPDAPPHAGIGGTRRSVRRDAC